MNQKKGSTENLIVLIGGTSSLGLALLSQYLLIKKTKIILACKDYKKYISTTSFVQDTSRISFFEYNALNNDNSKLIKILKANKGVNITVIYLPGIKEEGLNNFNNVIKINFIQPIALYETLKKEILHFTYIIIGSQGDIHSSSISPTYNSTKLALSNYFESVIYTKNKYHSVFFIKPWLFSSRMTNSSKIKTLLSSDVKKLAKYILSKSKGKSKYILYPRHTYFLVNSIKLISKRLLYLILRKTN
mgnify:CR=1 FL=1